MNVGTHYLIHSDFVYLESVFDSHLWSDEDSNSWAQYGYARNDVSYI